PFEVIYKKLEHDLPKPVAGLKAERAQLAEAGDRPHFDLQIVDAETQQPIPGADVRVRYFVNSWQPNNVTPPMIADVESQFQTDANAMFPFSFPTEMKELMLNLQVSVRHPDYVIEQSFGAWQVTAEMAANPAKAKEKFFPKGVISLKRGFEISGQILSPDGKPAQGVSLYAAWQMPEYLNMPPHAVTDADGRYKFRVGGFNETYLFIIPTDAVALSIPIQEQYGEHPVVKLEAGTVITGRVLDEKGQPLKDAVVQGNGNDTVYTGFPKPMARVATDAEGRYKLPPMKLPVDVRVDRFGYLGGWSRSYASPEGAYLPVMVRAPGADASGSSVGQPLVIDFRPAETVTLTARAYNEKGDLSVDEYFELVGRVPDPRAAVDQRGPNWRGSFRSVPGQVGVFQLKAPKGLVNATIDMTNSGSNSSQNIWTRAVRDEEKLEGPRTNAGWAVLDRDDDTIIVGTAP
ncbi:MAG: carboxypeptidase regulatory-like domain-containing protein, partial [Fuerstia sp.]|nr:carboxypeptidase regulatory-like domain-containing protein [Fuerstiella sp.]